MFAEELKPVAGRKYGEDVTIREIIEHQECVVWPRNGCCIFMI